jgi:predicted acylesterase/phospholipase RssA
MDVVLSSGFLAFAAHTGFLRAVEERGVAVDGLCGTSSGALVGALWAAGISADDVYRRLTRRAPLWWARPHLRPWRGAFLLSGVVAELGELLPATFEQLPRPFAVGVAEPGAVGHRLLDTGPLAEAVAASCAVPRLFAPVTVGGVTYIDGALADRTGLSAWREARGRRPVLLHLVDRSDGQPGLHEDDPEVTLVRSPRARTRLWSVGDAAEAHAATYERTLAALSRAKATG